MRFPCGFREVFTLGMDALQWGQPWGQPLTSVILGWEVEASRLLLLTPTTRERRASFSPSEP